MATKKKKITVDVKCCDICDISEGEQQPDSAPKWARGGKAHMETCVGCGQDTCNACVAQWEEDGRVCKECADKGIRIKYFREGGVDVVDKNGKQIPSYICGYYC